MESGFCAAMPLTNETTPYLFSPTAIATHVLNRALSACSCHCACRQWPPLPIMINICLAKHTSIAILALLLSSCAAPSAKKENPSELLKRLEATKDSYNQCVMSTSDELKDKPLEPSDIANKALATCLQEGMKYKALLPPFYRAMSGNSLPESDIQIHTVLQWKQTEKTSYSKAVDFVTRYRAGRP